VEKTAEAVTAAGGRGIGAVCDQRDDEQIQAVAHRIEAECGVLHLLVNNAWAGYERRNESQWTEWSAPFWQQPVALWDAMFDGGVRTHYVTSACCAPLLRRTAASMIVTVSMEAGAAHDPAQGVAYSIAKAADDRLAAAMAGQFAADGVASVAVYPGLVRTECVPGRQKASRPAVVASGSGVRACRGRPWSARPRQGSVSCAGSTSG